MKLRHCKRCGSVPSIVAYTDEVVFNLSAAYIKCPKCGYRSESVSNPHLNDAIEKAKEAWRKIN